MERPQTGDTQATLPRPEQAAEPLLLDRYRLERRLGAGGFGVVWQAWDERLQRDVAVKVLPREAGEEEGGRAEREARAAARLNHPGIVALYELTGDDHDVYLVTELVRGRSLAELLRARAPSDRDVARIGAALCDALEHAHARGVVHRDVKPQNVMVVADPAAGAGFAKLADFGVAHLAGGDRLTGTGDVLGTLAYMAPEQAEGREVSPASDVYSLALTLYEAWTGGNPVRGRSPAVTVRRLGARVPPLRRRRRDLPLDLCEAIDVALSRDAGRRPSPGELAIFLREAAPDLSDEGGLVEPETLERVGLPVAGPGPVGLGGAAARLGAGLAAGALVLLALTQLGPEPVSSAPGAAAVTAGVVALLPRLGWLGAALGMCVWLALPATGRPGTALLLAVALMPIPALLPRAGLLWSLPAAGPLLAAAGLGPAFVPLAGLAGNARRRAGLAAAGCLWLAVAEVITREPLLFGAPDGVLARSGWEGSLSAAASDALAPLVFSAALIPIVAWAVFAAVLPLAIHGRVVALDLVGGAVWAAGLVAVHAALADVVGQTAAVEGPRGAVAGAVLGTLAVVAYTAVGPAMERSGAPEAAEPAAAS